MLKKLSKAFVACMIMTLIAGATAVNESTPGIDWDRLSYDFGTITQGEVVETDFTVVNNRKDTFVIENAMGSCGCLASKWPRQPIMPGEKATITVKFDTKGKTGNQVKSVAVYTNKGLYSLSLNANIVKK